MSVSEQKQAMSASAPAAMTEEQTAVSGDVEINTRNAHGSSGIARIMVGAMAGMLSSGSPMPTAMGDGYRASPAMRAAKLEARARNAASLLAKAQLKRARKNARRLTAVSCLPAAPTNPKDAPSENSHA